MTRILTKSGNFFRLFKEKGFGGLWDRFLFWAWRTREYVALSKTIDEKVTDSSNDVISFRVATEEDIPWVCRNMEHLGEMTEQIIRQQFCDGDLTIIGMTKKEPDVLAFSVWLSRDDRAFQLLGDVVKPGEVSVRRVWVPPIMRKKGFATLGMHYYEYVAFKSGIRKVWSFIETDNINSILLHEKLDYKKHSIITINKRFGRAFANTLNCKTNKSVYRSLPPERTKL